MESRVGYTQHFTLPWGPTLNHYWIPLNGVWKINPRTGNRYQTPPRVIVSKQGKQYRDEVHITLRQQKVRRVHGWLHVTLLLTPPDRRRRDGDNTEKALFDALTHGGLWEDDRQVDSHLTMWHVRDGEIVTTPGGRVNVTVCEVTRGHSLFSMEEDAKIPVPSWMSAGSVGTPAR
ncbi:MAG: RusA family crossover junction endodeoxyribonuclease [Verrucomicrobiae bacterium]|nr:RusA family crossover junction endodeoxyribonuclease [Verrucomicrobiae bacterium]